MLISEDDEQYCPSLNLPSRKTLQEQLFQQLCADFPQLLFWNIHYLDGTIGIDIICSQDFTQWQELHEQVILALNLHTNLVEIRLLSLHEVLHHN